MPGTLTRMPAETDTHPSDTSGGGIFSGYGIASTVLGVVAVAAVVLAAVLWSTHRGDVDERSYQSRVMQTAVDWTGVLINMNKDTVEGSLQTLHDGTVGELNADFEGVVEPYRQVMQTLQSNTVGQIEAVALESIHHDAAAPGLPVSGAPPPKPAAQPWLAESASRTETVLVVATSVSENVGGKPRTVRWNLRLDVSDVDGKLLISRLEPIR